MKRKTFYLIAGIAAAVMTATSTQATTLNFTLYDPANDLNLTWEQDSAPTPNYYATGQGTDVPTITAFDPPYFDVSYFNENLGGGLYDQKDNISFLGPQIYFGTEANPVFSTGVYEGFFRSWTLDVSPVPEPAAWTVMLLGLAGIGGFARARRRTVAAA